MEKGFEIPLRGFLQTAVNALQAAECFRAARLFGKDGKTAKWASEELPGVLGTVSSAGLEGGWQVNPGACKQWTKCSLLSSIQRLSAVNTLICRSSSPDYIGQNDARA